METTERELPQQSSPMIEGCDESDVRLIIRNLARTPAQRLDALLNLLEVERWAHQARPVIGCTGGDRTADKPGV